MADGGVCAVCRVLPWVGVSLSSLVETDKLAVPIDKENVGEAWG